MGGTGTESVGNNMDWPKMAPRGASIEPIQSSLVAPLSSFGFSSLLLPAENTISPADTHKQKREKDKSENNDEEDLREKFEKTFDPSFFETVKDWSLQHELQDWLKHDQEEKQQEAEKKKKYKDKKAEKAARLQSLPEQKDLLPKNLPECFEGQEPKILKASDVNDISRVLFMGGSGCGKSTVIRYLVAEKKFPRNIVFCFSSALYDSGFGQLYERAMMWHYWDPFAIQKIKIQQSLFRKRLVIIENAIRAFFTEHTERHEKIRDGQIQDEVQKLRETNQWTEEKYRKELKKLTENEIPDRNMRKKMLMILQERWIAFERKKFGLSIVWDDIGNSTDASKSVLFKAFMSAGRHDMLFQCVGAQDHTQVERKSRSNFDRVFLLEDKSGDACQEFGLARFFPTGKGPGALREIFNYVGALNKRLMYGRYIISFGYGQNIHKLHDSFSMYYVPEKLPDHLAGKLGDPIFRWLAQIALDPRKLAIDDEQGAIDMENKVREEEKRKKSLKIAASKKTTPKSKKKPAPPAPKKKKGGKK